jgi:hypothetical protein
VTVTTTPTLDELLAAATERTPMKNADSKSGAHFERVVIGGERYVVKHFDIDSDWLLRASGDAGCRAVALWELGLYGALPAVIDATVVGAARVPGRAYPAALLMRDVSEWLIPEGNALVSLDDHRAYVDAMAALHAQFWGWRDTHGLLPFDAQLRILTPATARHELARGTDSEVLRMVEPGWDRLPADLAAVVRPLLDEPWPVAAALARTPTTFLAGDWKMGNLGRHPDGRVILLDWDRPGEGPATFELAWYLAVNCDRLPESKEATIDAYHLGLERRGVDTRSWWDEQLPLALLSAFLMLGWTKTWPGQERELAWWRPWVHRAAALL